MNNTFVDIRCPIFNKLINRLLPKCNDRNKKAKRPFLFKKFTNFTRKLANFGTFLKLKMLLISQIPLGSIRLMYIFVKINQKVTK